MLVTDRLVGTPVLVRIDPVTGAQTTVSAGGAVNFEGAVFRSGSIL